MAINDPTTDPPAPLPDGWLEQQSPEVQSAIKGLRSENARWRIRHKAMSEKLAGGDPTTLAALQAENKALKTREKLRPVAQRHGIDLDVSEYMLKDKLATFDPGSDDAGDQLDEWMSALVGANPELKKVNIPQRSGGEFRGPGGPPSDQLTRTDLAAMRPEEVAAALAAGRLDSILGRRR